MTWVLIGAATVFCLVSWALSSNTPSTVDLVTWVLALIFVLVVAYGIGSAML